MAGRIKMALMVLALVGANGSWTSDAPTLKGRVLGGDGTGGVWLGVVGGDPEAANWTLIEGEYFEVPAPPGERASLVAMAKDRVPLVVSLPAGEQRRHVELRLAQGLALEGTARSDDGNLLRGAAIRISRGNAIVPDVLGIAVPLKKAKIEVVLADGSRVEVPPFARPRWETNRHGAFRIGGLETGRHFLEATAEGYVPALLKDVTVREGAVNAAELVLFKGFLVVGQVVDGDGAPVAGAEVRADWMQPTAEPHRDWGELVHREVRRHTTGRTGDDGSFRLGPFEAGPKVEVFATSPELGSSKRLEVFAPYDGLVLALRRDVVRGRVVDAATGEPVESFQLRAHRNGRTHSTRHADGHFEVQVDPDTDSLHIEAPGRFAWFTRLFTGKGGVHDLGEVALERERSITGRVRNAKSGEPIAGASVRRAWQHYDDAPLRVFTANWFGSHGAETRTDGTFVLGYLPTHADRLEVVGFGHQPWFVRFVDLPRDVTHLEIEVALDTVIAGSLGLPDGTPARGIVKLRGSEGYLLKQEVGADGTFRWDGLEGGEYRLTAESDAGAVESRAVVVGNGESVKDLRLVVEPGGRVSGLIAGLMRTEHVMVSFRDADGRIVLQREYGNGSYSQGIPEVATVTARTTADRVLGRMLHLDDQREARVDLDFSGSSRLTGTVRAGGRLLAGIELVVVPEDRSRPIAYATTSELGHYAVYGISDGPHSVRTRTGHSFDVHVAHHATLDLDLPPISLSGTVRDSRTGRGVAGGWVRLERVDAPADSRPVVLRVRIAGDGVFRFEGLARGEYVARVSHPDFGDVSRRIHIAGPEAVEFHLKSADGGGAGPSAP